MSKKKHCSCSSMKPCVLDKANNPDLLPLIGYYGWTKLSCTFCGKEGNLMFRWRRLWCTVCNKRGNIVVEPGPYLFPSNRFYSPTKSSNDWVCNICKLVKEG